MTHSRWYVRVRSKAGGPFPAAQVVEKILLGRVPPSAEVSVDGEAWQLIQDIEEFAAAFRDLQSLGKPASGDEQDWARERALAKQRWLDERVEVTQQAGGRAPEPDGLGALRHDHAETEVLIEQAIHSRPRYWVALVALVGLSGLAVAVWYGQQHTSDNISAQLASAANCAAPPAPGVTWQGCDRRGARLSGANLKGAHLARTRLDGADLSGVDLSYADLKGVSLRSANLSGARLLAADLSGADLSGADLGNARLDYAILQDARLDGTRFAATRLAKAVWADGRLCAPEAVDVCQ